MMCRRASLALTLAFVAGLGHSLAAAEETSAPRARVEVAEASVDLGMVNAGARVSHTFTIHNSGEAPLEIRGALPGPSITVSQVEPEPIIAPGGSARITVELDALLLNEAGSTKVTLFTNDPDRETVELQVSFKIQRALHARPGYARWIYVQLEPGGTIGQLLWAADGQPFEVTGVETPHPFLAASFRPATPEERDAELAGPQWRLELGIDPQAEVGPITGAVVVHTTHAIQKRMAIPVSGFVRPRYFLEPASGALGTLNLDAPKTVAYKLRNFATDPVSVTGVETTVPGITGEVTVDKPGQFFTVTLQLDPAAMAAGPFSGKAVIKLSDPLQPTLELPITGELASPASG